GVRAAEVPRATSGEGLHAGDAAVTGVGLRVLRRRPHGRRPRAAPAGQARRGARGADLDPAQRALPLLPEPQLLVVDAGPARGAAMDHVDDVKYAKGRYVVATLDAFATWTFEPQPDGTYSASGPCPECKGDAFGPRLPEIDVERERGLPSEDVDVPSE